MREVLWGGWFSRPGPASLVIALCFLIGDLIPAQAQTPQTRNAGRRKLSVADLPKFKIFEEVAASPDGRWVAYTMTRPVPGKEPAGTGRITILDLRRKTRRDVPVGNEAHGLAWSPVESKLAFIAPSDSGARIWLYDPMDPAGKARLLNSSDTLARGVQAIAWSPDGSHIGYLAKPPKKPQADSTNSPPRIVMFRDEPGVATGSSSDYYRPDSVGLYLGVAPAEGASSRVVARDLVTTQVWPMILQWARSDQLLVSGGPLWEPSPQVLARRRLYIVDARTGASRQVAPDNPARFRPALAPSGQALAYLELAFFPEARGVPFFSMRLSQVHQPDSIIDLSALHDMDGLEPLLPPVWADERTLYVGRHVNATARLYRIHLDSRQWRPVTPDTLSVTAYTTASQGEVLLAVLENANQQQELYRVEPRTGALTRLTGETESQPPLHLGRVDQVRWLGLDGRFTVHGFLLKPPGYDPRRRYPLIVMIHGGPGATYPNHFRDINLAFGSSLPPQLLAASGYLVLLPNPRGDSSYGLAYRDAILGDYGPGPLADVMGGVADLIHRGMVDSSAVGVYGSSYGAYLAAFAITQTDRFAAAAIDDGPMNLTSFYGQSYAISSPHLKHYMRGSPSRRAPEYIAQSPITHVDRVRTPVLMLYGGSSVTGDNVRPSYMLAQGLEFYAGLKDHDVPVEFIIHPDQGHGTTDWGLFQEDCNRILRWFGRWLLHEDAGTGKGQ